MYKRFEDVSDLNFGIARHLMQRENLELLLLCNDSPLTMDNGYIALTYREKDDSYGVIHMEARADGRPIQNRYTPYSGTFENYAQALRFFASLLWGAEFPRKAMVEANAWV